MKRIFIVSLLALTVALGAVATGCSGGNTIHLQPTNLQARLSP